MPHSTTSCSNCPFANHIEGDRYDCTNKVGLATVVKGHWEPSTDCTEAIEAVQVAVPETARDRNVRLTSELKEAAAVVGVALSEIDYLSFAATLKTGSKTLGQIGCTPDGNWWIATYPYTRSDNVTNAYLGVSDLAALMGLIPF